MGRPRGFGSLAAAHRGVVIPGPPGPRTIVSISNVGLGYPGDAMRHAAAVQAADLADMMVQDEQGQPYRLGDAWKDRTAVLAFVRHFG